MKLTKASARKWQARWVVIAAVEREELRALTVAEKFRQTERLFRLFPKRGTQSESMLRAGWRRLHAQDLPRGRR
jgi:hypothetical protein